MTSYVIYLDCPEALVISFSCKSILWEYVKCAQGYFGYSLGSQSPEALGKYGKN